MGHLLTFFHLNPDQASNLIEQTEGQALSNVSHTTKAHAHPSTLSAPSRLLRYSRTNNDSHIPLNSESVADARRGKRLASPTLLSLILKRTDPPSPVTTLPHSASPTVSVLSASQPTSPFASERASSSRTTPSSSLPQSPSFGTASSDKAILVTPMQRPNPSGSCLDDPPTPLFCNSREESADRTLNTSSLTL